MSSYVSYFLATGGVKSPDRSGPSANRQLFVIGSECHCPYVRACSGELVQQLAIFDVIEMDLLLKTGGGQELAAMTVPQLVNRLLVSAQLRFPFASLRVPQVDVPVVAGGCQLLSTG